MNKTNYYWDQFFMDSARLAEEIKAVSNPKSIIAISRGGLFLAGILSQKLNIKMVDTICIEKKVVIKEPRLIDLPRPVLLVDDEVESGKTMQSALKFVPWALGVVLFYGNKSELEPDFYVKKTGNKIVFPWE